MTNTLPKWTEDRTAALAAEVNEDTLVTRDDVAQLAEQFETSTRSIASKLRKMGYSVETVAAAPKAFSDDEAEALRNFVENNEGAFTYGEIAEQFADGKFTSKAIQGKLLSMELTGSVKATPKAETPKSYTEAEEAKVVELANAGKFLEEIADAVGKSVASVRGKALSLSTSGVIAAIPAQRDKKAAAVDPYEALGDLTVLTVEEIAEKLDKTERGVKTTLTRRGLVAKNYNGAAKQKKAAE